MGVCVFVKAAKMGGGRGVISSGVVGGGGFGFALEPMMTHAKQRLYH